MKITTAFKKICKLKKRVKVIQGSQGASKTYSQLQIWILKSSRSKKAQLCSIVTDTFPALRTGAIKDFKEICDNEDIPYKGTKTPYVFKINKWTFEFYSVDKESKGRGGRRDRLFINEANRMSWKISQQLISRTHVEVVLDFNPVEYFWAHEQFVETGEGDFIKLTYKDNEQLPQSERLAIERHAPNGAVPDDNYWRVYGLGEVGFVEGMIFKNYEKYDELPEGEYQESVGVDFGDVHPTTAVKVWVDHKRMRIYWKELFYASGTSYAALGIAIKAHEGEDTDVMLQCDHDPKAIRMLREDGLTAYRANKKGGIPSDIRLIKQYKLFINSGSENLIYEIDNYKYQQKGDRIIDYPDQRCVDHAIDAGRYGSIFAIKAG